MLAFGHFPAEHALHSKLLNLFTTSFLFTLLKHIIHWMMFGHSFLLEIECWHSKKVSYSNTAFIK